MKKKRKAHRPKRVIDYKKVEELAMDQCTEEEIAGCLGYTQTGFSLRKKDDPKLRDALIAGRNGGKVSLRRYQWKIACKENAQGCRMLIHLGQQYLGQSNKHEITQEINKKYYRDLPEEDV